MLYLCVVVLGALSSFALSAAGVFAVSSVLVVGVGVAGAVTHQPLLGVLLEAGAVSITLQLAYAVPLLWALVWPLPYAWTKRWAVLIAASVRSWRL